jgi:hypothetical protein
MHVGMVGEKNLVTHCNSKACKAGYEQKQHDAKSKSNGSLLTFFGPRAVPNPLTVSAPPPVHAPTIDHTKVSTLTKSFSSSFPSLPPATSQPPPAALDEEIPMGCCPVAKWLLSELTNKMKQIPDTTPDASEDHHLAIFSGDPAGCVSSELDNWEDVLNPMMKWAFDWGTNTENFEVMKGLAWRGRNGLGGFYRFIKYFIIHRGLQGVLVETKVRIILAAINFKCIILVLDQLKLLETHNDIIKDSHPIQWTRGSAM